MLSANTPASVHSSINAGVPTRDRTPPNLLRLNLGSQPPPLSLNTSFPQTFSKSSARERSPVPSLEQAVTEKLKAINDL
jgi:hypothetical protein